MAYTAKTEGSDCDKPPAAQSHYRSEGNRALLPGRACGEPLGGLASFIVSIGEGPGGVDPVKPDTRRVATGL